MLLRLRIASDIIVARRKQGWPGMRVDGVMEKNEAETDPIWDQPPLSSCAYQALLPMSKRSRFFFHRLVDVDSLVTTPQAITPCDGRKDEYERQGQIGRHP